MPYLVDGHNLLGALRLDRESGDVQRDLARRLGALARARKTKVYCVFDGEAPEQFGRTAGNVTVEFSGHRTADDLIEKRCATGSSWKVVTADRRLADRVRRRAVEVVEPKAFAAELEELSRKGDDTPAGGEWVDYFSDPKNRNI
jgi:predicted RNA-binding protein with PIN domain